MNEGNNAVAYFWEAVRKGLIAHFFLFCGDTRCHREQALALAATLNCREKHRVSAGYETGLGERPVSEDPCRFGEEALFCGECTACRKIMSGCHPDVEIIQPAKASIGIEQVVSLQKMVSREPYEGYYKVYIIEEAEKLTLPAANALLVTAEEPSERTVLVMSCASDAAVLPTLRSRARTVFFPFDEAQPTGKQTDEEQTDEEWRQALRLSAGNTGLAREVMRVGAAHLSGLTALYDEAVGAGDFLRLFALFPMERETALIWLQVMAERTVAGLRAEGEGAGESAGLAHEAALVLPWIKEALRALQRQADVRLTIEVMALKYIREFSVWQK